MLWISYVFLKSPNAHASVQRINIVDVSDPCGKLERLAHVANYVFRKGFLPANVRSLVHWEDACKRRIEEHVCVKDVLCDRGVGKDEDTPLRLVIGLDSAFVAEWTELEADSGSLKTTPPASAEMHDGIKDVTSSFGPIPPEQNSSKLYTIPQISSPPYHTISTPPSSTSSSKLDGLSETYAIPPVPSPPYQASSPSLSSALSRPLSALEGECNYSLWTFHYILFGTLLFLSYTSVLYPRIYCVCEQCRLQ